MNSLHLPLSLPLKFIHMDATELDVRCLGAAATGNAPMLNVLGLFEVLDRRGIDTGPWTPSRQILVRLREQDVPLLCPLYAHRLRVQQTEDGTAHITAWLAVHPSFYHHHVCPPGTLASHHARHIAAFVGRHTHFSTVDMDLGQDARTRRLAGVAVTTLHAIFGPGACYMLRHCRLPVDVTFEGAAHRLLASRVTLDPLVALKQNVAAPAAAWITARLLEALPTLSIPALARCGLVDVPGLFALLPHSDPGEQCVATLRLLLVQPGRAASVSALLARAPQYNGSAGALAGARTVTDWLGRKHAEEGQPNASDVDLYAFCLYLSRAPDAAQTEQALWARVKEAAGPFLPAVLAAAHVASRRHRRLQTGSIALMMRVLWSELAASHTLPYNHALAAEDERALFLALLPRPPAVRRLLSDSALSIGLAEAGGSSADPTPWLARLAEHRRTLAHVALCPEDVFRCPPGDVPGHAVHAGPLLARHSHTACVVVPAGYPMGGVETMNYPTVRALATAALSGTLPAHAARLTHVCLLEAHAYTAEELVLLLDAIVAVRAANAAAVAYLLGSGVPAASAHSTTLVVGCPALAGPFSSGGGGAPVSGLRSLLGNTDWDVDSGMHAVAQCLPTLLANAGNATARPLPEQHYISRRDLQMHVHWRVYTTPSETWQRSGVLLTLPVLKSLARDEVLLLVYALHRGHGRLVLDSAAPSDILDQLINNRTASTHLWH